MSGWSGDRIQRGSTGLSNWMPSALQVRANLEISVALDFGLLKENKTMIV